MPNITGGITNQSQYQDLFDGGATYGAMYLTYGGNKSANVNTNQFWSSLEGLHISAALSDSRYINGANVHPLSRSTLLCIRY